MELIFAKNNHVYKSLTMSRDYISEVVLKVVYVTWCRGYRTKGKEDPELYLQPQNLVSWHTWQIRTQNNLLVFHQSGTDFIPRLQETALP